MGITDADFSWWDSILSALLAVFFAGMAIYNARKYRAPSDSSTEPAPCAPTYVSGTSSLQVEILV